MIYQGPGGHLFRRYEQRCIPPTSEPCPVRAAHVELAWRDPAAARRERLQAQVGYWRRRWRTLHDRVEALKALRDKAGLPAAEADVMEARRRLEEIERAAREAGVDLGPFELADAPAPEPAQRQAAAEGALA